MNVSEIAMDTAQIGGGAGYFRNQLREAQRIAKEALQQCDTKNWAVPRPGSDTPRLAAMLSATQDSIRILNEVLHIEAPMDAVVDTRHALEALVQAQKTIESFNQKQPLNPVNFPAGSFTKAIELLSSAEHRLAAPNELAGGANGNSGVVPPWLL